MELPLKFFKKSPPPPPPSQPRGVACFLHGTTTAGRSSYSTGPRRLGERGECAGTEYNSKYDKQQKTHFKSIENILIYENYTLMWLASLLDVYTTSRPRGVAGAHCSLLVLLVGNLVILTLALDANTGFDVIETNTVSI